MATLKTILRRVVLFLFCLPVLASQATIQDGVTDPIISSWRDIVERYEQFRDDSYPLIAPGGDYLAYGSWEKVQSDLTAFVKGSWFWYFPASCYRVNPKTKLSRQIRDRIDLLVYEDVYTGEIVIAKERKDGAYVEVYSQKTVPILEALALGMTTFEEISRRRIVWQPSVVPYDYIEPTETVVESAILARATTLSVPSPPSGGTNSGSGAVLFGGMTLERWEAIHSATNMWIEVERQGTNGNYTCRIIVHPPTNVTHSVDVFSRNQIASNAPWSLAAGALPQNAQNCAVWTTTVEGVVTMYYRAADAIVDSDSDNLADGRERFMYATNPYDHDSDNDGIDDGQEIADGGDPLDPVPQDALNVNWIYHNYPDAVSASWELLPGRWERFFMQDRTVGTNSVFILMPKEPVANTNAVVQAGCRWSWFNPDDEQWYSGESYGEYHAETCIPMTNKFHGLPTMGVATVDIYRISWPCPSVTSEVVHSYYAPFVNVSLNGTTNKTYLLADATDNNGGAALFATNNWYRDPQLLGDYCFNNDYKILYDVSLLENGGFEAETFGGWGAFGDSAEVVSTFSHAGTKALRLGNYQSGVYQVVGVQPGEELVLSAAMMHPSISSSDPYPLTGYRTGMLSLEFYENGGTLPLLTRYVQLTAENDAGVWMTLAVTSVVPNKAMHAQVSVRVFAPDADEGSGVVYFDSVSLSISEDADQDGMPDRWEADYSALSSSDPWDNFEDPDGDGLVNLYEYRWYTSPMNADTDGDGIEDYWEIMYRMNPVSASDAEQDWDNDGLSNREEFENGTQPWIEYSDGNGIPDSFLGAAAYITDTNPVVLADLDGDEYTATVGLWSADTNGHLVAGDLRGSVSYAVTLTNTELACLEIVADDAYADRGMKIFEFALYIDDIFIRRLWLWSYDAYGGGTVKAWLPALSAGTHTVKLLWDNASEANVLRLQHVMFHTFNGTDSNSDGVKDWITEVVRNRSSIELPISGQSVVSPACIEGLAEFPVYASATGGVSVSQGGGEKWYADIPLNAESDTVVSVDFENGALGLNTNISWVPLNIWTSNSVVLRCNDSLKLTMCPVDATNGSFVISGESGSYTGLVPGASILTFLSAGVSQVTGVYTYAAGGSVTSVLEVTVVCPPSNVAYSPLCWSGIAREWYFQNCADAVRIEMPAQVTWSDYWTNSSLGVRAKLPSADKWYAVLRAGEAGPIITNFCMRGFRLGMGEETYTKVADMCQTRDAVAETRIVCSPVYSDMLLSGYMVVGGITYADGSTTNLITMGEFDAAGTYPLLFIVPAEATTSACNVLEVWQDGEYVGRYEY